MAKSLVDLSMEALGQLPLNPNFARDLARIDKIIDDMTWKVEHPKKKISRTPCK